MINKFLDESYLQKGYEISFILGHLVLFKKGQEWNELSQSALTLSEWEDLKDLCLQSAEKIQLETKGFTSGMYHSTQSTWKFSFVEKADCFKAYFSAVKEISQLSSDLDNPLLWDMIQKSKGIFIIGGERRQGKTTLLSEIIEHDQKNKLSMVGVCSLAHQHKWPQMDSVIHLGSDAVELENDHEVYQGLEKIVFDLNQIRDWNKCLSWCESGQSVLISMHINSVKSLLLKLSTELKENDMVRFLHFLNGVVIQKIVGVNQVPIHEVLTLRQADKEKMIDYYLNQKNLYKLKMTEFAKDGYSSFNQSLIQKLIRRKLDVQTAFAASEEPDQLDEQLKKLGL